MNPSSSRIRWMFQKNQPFLDALLMRRAPDFVVERNPPIELAHVPVFTFHVAVPERFERQCLHLADNGYHTLTADELARVMRGTLRAPRRSVVLTFDDGLKQVWTVAFPILKKYGLKGVVFLVPGCIEESNDHRVRPTLEDVWAGWATEQSVFGIAPGEPPLATWPEIVRMHESGVIDFQSHTMWHSLVATSRRIVDFGRTGLDPHFFGNIHVPMYQTNGIDVTARTLELGLPLYTSAPRMQVAARYFDDPGVREHCIATVARHGGSALFDQRGWRVLLDRTVRDYHARYGWNDRIESAEERDAAIVAELQTAKQAIESRLPGKRVEHLCFPWYKGALFAEHCAAATGHVLTYHDSERGRGLNVPGTSTRVARIEENFLRRLPGRGRMTKREIVQEAIELRGLKRHMFSVGTATSPSNGSPQGRPVDSST